MSKNPNDRLEQIVENADTSAVIDSNKHSPDVQQKAMIMYLHLSSVPQISKALDVPESTINSWTKTQHWSQMQQKVIKQLFGNLYARRREDMEDIIGMGLSTIKKGIAYTLARKEPPTMRECQLVTDVITRLDKTIRLDEGKPTDILQTMSMEAAKDKVRKVLGEDPFGEFEDVIEIKNLPKKDDKRIN